MDDYRKTIISQYSNSPTLTYLIDRFNEWLDPAADVAGFLAQIWTLETCAGVWLDLWGRILGVSRYLRWPAAGKYMEFAEADGATWGSLPFYSDPGSPLAALSDSSYRALLLAKRLAMLTPTTAAGINAVLKLLLPGHTVYVTDPCDMTAEIHVSGPLSLTERAILTQTKILPWPAGVGQTIVVS